MGVLRLLSTDQVRVAAAPEHGFTITSIERIGLDENVLWTPVGAAPRRLPADDLGPSGDASIDSFDRGILIGGWFPMFPTAGPPGKRTERWMHGALARLAWTTIEESERHITAEVAVPATSLQVRRTVTVDGPTVTVATHAVNLADRPVDVTFGEHPCFSRAVFAGGRLSVAPRRAVATDHADPGNALLAARQVFAWPRALDVDGGPVDLSLIPAEPDGRHDHVSLKGVSRARITGPRHVIELAWDGDVLPHALLWEHFAPEDSPWNGDVFAVEPMSAAGRTFDDAVNAHAVRSLGPDEPLASWMTLTVTAPL